MDIARIHTFFGRLNVDMPTSTEELERFVNEQNSNWAEALERFQKLRKEWAREWLKLDALKNAKSPNEKAIEAQELVENEARALFKSSERPMLQARGREEVARALIEALEGDKNAQRFVERQLDIAEAYVFRP